MKFTKEAQSVVERFTYDGLFIVGDLTSEQQREIEHAAKSVGVSLDLEGGIIELEYVGRDAERWYVNFLRRIANIVRDAEGEVRCEITTDEIDPLFEFYRIRNSQLLREAGRIIRGVTEVVT
ncbi:MAG TPA: hypothetical protein VF493_02985 [Terriglobales bacterium]